MLSRIVLTKTTNYTILVNHLTTIVYWLHVFFFLNKKEINPPPPCLQLTVYSELIRLFIGNVSLSCLNRAREFLPYVVSELYALVLHKFSGNKTVFVLLNHLTFSLNLHN